MSADEFERIRPEIRALVARGNITPAELREIRCNSWEWEALVPAMNDEAFCERMQYTLDNCFTRRERPFTTYNQALEGLWAPELLKRFSELREDIHVLSHVTEFYADKGGNESMRARLALMYVRGEIVIVKCSSCGDDLVKVPLSDDAEQVDDVPVCHKCGGPKADW